jgi:membrane-bound ClpP family serine protease
MESEKIKPRHDLAKIIGEIGEARTDIYNEGSVQIESELWSARSTVKISEGSKVRVVKRDGFILEVEPVTLKDK